MVKQGYLMAFFDSLPLLPDDPILSIPKIFGADPRPGKVNLGIGTYKDAEGASYTLDCVRDAESALATKKLSKEYLPIEGHSELLQLTKNLIFGKNILEKFSENISIVQTIGGTGALSLGGEFLSKKINPVIYIPNSTWPNHKLVFNASGMEINHYRYFDDRSHQMDFDRMYQDISEMPAKSIILLHACCHNPTGIDPTNDQWMELSSLIKKQQLIPFFDFAYQGFKASIDDDAFAVRYFTSQGHELLVANSFAKNFGLYGERVGTLSFVTHSKESAQKILSQLKQLIRSNYSTPPRHGAEIISHILSNENLKKNWIAELGNMRDRLKEMRHTLIAGLQAKGSHHDWSFLSKQSGFFSFCSLNESQVHRLIKDYGIYMPANGRINVGGLNSHNMNYVIDALLDVTHS